MSQRNYWTRQISRRRALQGGATLGVGAAALGLIGCGDDDDDSPPAGETPATGETPAAAPTQAEAKVNKDGILKSRQGAPYSSINPWKGLDSGLLWGFTIFDHLWATPRDTGKPELFLAEKIEQPDPLTINVTLKESFFHDKAPVNGRLVKASDVKASWETAAKQTAISNSSWWRNILERVDAPDDRTVSIKMKAVDAWTFSSTNAGTPIASSIIPEEIAKDPAFMDRDLIGSGRYQFLSHENGTNFKIRRNPKWRIQGEPFLAGIDYRLIQEQAQAVAAFSTKEIDAVTAANKLEREQLVQRHGKDITVDNEVSTASWILLGRGDGIWTDPRVRQAIGLSVDRKEYIELMSFGDGVASGPVPPPFTAYALTESEMKDTYLKYDPAEAKKLLSAASFDTSKEYQLKFIVPGDNRAQMAQIAQSQLSKIGIKVKLVGEDLGTWLQKSLYGSEYDGFIAFQNLAYDDPTSYLGIYNKEIGGRPNWARYLDDELDKMVIDQKTIIDDELRAKAVKDIQRKAFEKHAPAWTIYSPITQTCTWNYVKGRTTGRGSYGLYSGRVYIDKG
jgi:peptide/nickel transport system substrate-binding protein